MQRECEVVSPFLGIVRRRTLSASSFRARAARPGMTMEHSVFLKRHAYAQIYYWNGMTAARGCSKFTYRRPANPPRLMRSGGSGQSPRIRLNLVRGMTKAGLSQKSHARAKNKTQHTSASQRRAPKRKRTGA